MKLETKKLIERIVIFFSPVFTLIMFMLPCVALIKEKTEYNSSVYQHQEFVSYIDALKIEGHIFSKILMWGALFGIVATLVLYILSTVFKDKEKLLMKIGVIVLVVATGMLFLTTLEGNFSDVSLAGAKSYTWIDFMTPVYGILIVYNVGCLIYYLKKMK